MSTLMRMPRTHQIASPAGTEPTVSYAQILLFWLPLGAMWIMMAAEQPALTAIVARLPEAEINLAAFGVVFALTLAIESPVIQMLAAGTAVCNNRANYQMLLRFMHVLAVGLTGLHLLIALTPLYDLIVGGLLNIPPPIVSASRLPFIIMAPFTAAVGYRRLWQGVLIRHGRTWIVPLTMISRLGVVAVLLAIGYTRGTMPGGVLATIALSVGVSAAAVTAGVLNRVLVVPALGEPAEGDHVYSWRGLFRFYAPLSLTTIVFLLSQPVVTFGIARALAPQRSLAAWPVVNAYMFLFNSIALSHQESAIALLNRNPTSHRKLARFTFGLAASLSGAMLVTAITPIGAWWFRTVSGLAPPLLSLTTVPLLLLSIVPGLTAYKAWYRAQYVAVDRTSVLARGVVIYTVILVVSVFAGSGLLPLVGVTVAALSLAIAQAAENGYLMARLPHSTDRQAGSS